MTIKNSTAQGLSETAETADPVGDTIAAPTRRRSGDGISRVNSASPTDEERTSPQIEMGQKESFEQRVAAVFHREAANLQKEAPPPPPSAPRIYTEHTSVHARTALALARSPACGYLG
jgi:hypothetical protein